MTFPAGTGIDSNGDMSGAAWDTTGANKIEWANMLNSIFNPVTNAIKTETTTTVVSGMTRAKATITFNGGATQAVVTLPAKSIVYDVLVVITTAFDGASTIDIGYAANPDALLADAHITKTVDAVNGADATLRGVDLFSTVPLNHYYKNQTAIIASVTSSGTTGAADVYVIYA